MNTQQTLKALYLFTAENYDSLKQDWNKLPQHDKSKLPLTLFIIQVFDTILHQAQVGTSEGSKNEEVQPSDIHL